MLQLLRQRMRDGGHGVMADVQRRLALRPTFFSEKPKVLDVGVVLQVLGELEIPAAELLAELERFAADLEAMPTVPAGAEAIAEHYRQGRHPAEEPATGEGVDRAWLERMDARRYEDPRGTIDRLLRRAAEVPPGLHAAFLGVCGSAYRIRSGTGTIRSDLATASRFIRLGQYVARQRRDPLARADLLLRFAYVLADRGHLAEALLRAERANAIFDRAEDRVGRGRALVDQGRYLYYLDRPREAIAAFSAALQLLPDSERRNRFSAFQILGLCCRQIGQLEVALRYAVQAAPLAPGRWFEGRLRWLQAELHLDLGDLPAAEEHLRAVVEIFRQLHHGEAALASCDLVRVLLLRGQPAAAWATAAAVCDLIIPLGEHQMVTAALVELLRGGEAALTLERVEKAGGQIREARERQDWRSLRAGS